MTVEAFAPTEYRVMGAGPYRVPFPYAVGCVRVSVLSADERIELAPDQWQVEPGSSTSAGDVTLSPQAALAYAGLPLFIDRSTNLEQGWAGLLGAREKGLERQLDLITMTVQELLGTVARALLFPRPIPSFQIKPGHALMGGPFGGIVVGPNAADIAKAQEYAEEVREIAGGIRYLRRIRVEGVIGEFTDAHPNLSEIRVPGTFEQAAALQVQIGGGGAQPTHAYTVTPVPDPDNAHTVIRPASGKPFPPHLWGQQFIIIGGLFGTEANEEADRAEEEADRAEREADRAEAAVLSVAPYGSRAEAEDAFPPHRSVRIEVLHAGRVLGYVEDIKGTALETADGRRWSPNGVPTPFHFGAIGDGVTEDLDAMRAFLAFFDADRADGPEVADLAGGRYLLSGPIWLKEPANPGNFRSILKVGGASLICNYNRDTGEDTFFTIGDLNNPKVFNSTIEVGGGVWFLERSPTCVRPPIGITAVGFAQSMFDDLQCASWPGTVLQFLGVQNVYANRAIIYGGGLSLGFKDASGSTFQQSGSVLKRLSGDFVFDPTCVGKTIEVMTLGGMSLRKCCIIERLSDTEVRVGERVRKDGAWSAKPLVINDSSARMINFGSAAVTCTAGDPVIKVDGEALTQNMTGAIVAIPLAGENGATHIASIVSLFEPDGAIRIDPAPAASLDPLANPISDTVDIGVPVILIRSYDASNGISQVFINQYQAETCRGFDLVVDDAEFVTLTDTKFHGSSTSHSNWRLFSVGCIVANRLNGYFELGFDQRFAGSHRIWLADQTMPITFGYLQMRTMPGEKLMHIGKPALNPGMASVVMRGFNPVGADESWDFDRFVDTDVGGACIPPIAMTPNNAPARFTLGKVKVNADGLMEVPSLRVLDHDGEGLVIDTTAGDFRARGQAARFRAQDTDTNGRVGFKAENSTDSRNFELLLDSGSGDVVLQQNGTTRLRVRPDGGVEFTLPGPYADDAAAAAGGIAVGETYRNASGGTAWRQT